MPAVNPRHTTPARRTGPGPSKAAYRLRRAWAKPWLRNLALVYLPLVLLAALGWRVVSQDQLRLAIQAEAHAVIESVMTRPEFTVRGVTVTGGTEELRAEVRQALGPLKGLSSLKLDIDGLRAKAERVGAVAEATVQLDPTGRLQISVTERLPAVVWRRVDGTLSLLDHSGAEIGPLAHRAMAAKLPLLLGTGAEDHVGEALALMDVAPSMVPRLRGFVRVGERRWDVVLAGPAGDLVIMLPEEDAAKALAGVMALHYGEELLDRHLAAIDLRLRDRPAMRMAPEAAETLILQRAIAEVVGEDT